MKFGFLKKKKKGSGIVNKLKVDPGLAEKI